MPTKNGCKMLLQREKNNVFCSLKNSNKQNAILFGLINNVGKKKVYLKKTTTKVLKGQLYSSTTLK